MGTIGWVTMNVLSSTQQTNMVQKVLLLCILAVAYVSAAPVPRPLNNIIDIAVNKSSIVGVAAANPDLFTLVNLLKAGGLVDTLSSAGPFTVFAPTNEAFAKLPLVVLKMLVEPKNVETLKKVLTYHVVAGAAVFSKDLTNNETFKTVEGESVVAHVSTAGVKINDATVTTADVAASNGVIHIISSVLLPPGVPLPPMPTQNIVALAASIPDLSTLVAALKAGELITALSGKGPFTVFAPTNEAFAALPDGTLAHLLDPVNIKQLQAVLEYHVIPDAAMRSFDLADDVTTLEGKDVHITRRDGSIFINDAKVTTADTDTTNGVVHIIDQVLIPPTTPAAPAPSASIVAVAEANPSPSHSPGSKIWSFATGKYVDSSPALSIDGKVVYVGSDDNSLYAVNASTGSKIWSFATRGAVGSSPTLSSDGKVVYIGSYDNNLYAVNASTASKIWTFANGNQAESSPVLSSDGKVVYVGSDDNSLYAVNALTGSKIWSFSTGDATRGGPVTSSVLSSDDKVVYIGCSGYTSLYAVNVSTASKIWAFANGNQVESSPVLSSDGKVVYFGSYAVHASTGSEMWTFADDDLSSSPALSSDGKVLYVGSQDEYGKGDLYALNALTGSKIWSFATGGPVHSTPVLSSDSKVYVGSTDSSLYAVNTDSNGVLIPPTMLRGSQAVSSMANISIASKCLDPCDGAPSGQGSCTGSCNVCYLHSGMTSQCITGAQRKCCEKSQPCCPIL